jgi:hypothetical protein
MQPLMQVMQQVLHQRRGWLRNDAVDAVCIGQDEAIEPSSTAQGAVASAASD